MQNNNSKFRIFKFIIGFIIGFLLIISFFPSSVFAANYPLEIIQPRAGLDIKNRFYKAYPGLEYNVRLAVIGGVYPFTHSFTSAPSGMTINSSTGGITWSNPTTSGSPYTVTAKVVDSEGTQTSVTWTITVTTSGFLFVDAVNGNNSNSGTISSPKKDFLGIYGGTAYADKRTNTYQDYFVYFRQGTYYMDGYVSGESYVQWMPRYKPNVWLAYPGETATISMANHDVFFYEESAPGLYIDGFNIDASHSSVHTFQYEAGMSHVTFRKLNFTGMKHGTAGGNPSLMFQARTGTPGSGKYHVIQDCTYVDPGNAVDENGYFFLLYTSDRTLFEDNSFSDLSVHGIGPKDSITNVFVRNNRFTNCPSGALHGLLWNDTGYTTADLEISYNLFKSTGNSNIVELDADSFSGTIGKVYFLRNTLIGMVDINNVSSNKGPYYFYNNVIINTYTSDSDHIYVHNSSAPTRVIRGNNLSGVAGDNIVDSNGNLTSAYSQYLGTRGFQLISTPPDTTPPAAPTGVMIS